MIGPLGAVLGLATIWLGLIPGILYVLADKPRPAPFMAFTGLFYAVCFGLPVFTFPLIWPDAPPIVDWPNDSLYIDSEPRTTLLLQAVAVALMLAAFYLCRRTLFDRLPHFRIWRSNETSAVVILLWLLLAAHFAYELIPAIRALPSIGQFLDPAAYVGLGGLLVLWLDRRLSSFHSLVALVALGLEFYLRLSGMLLSAVAFLGLFFAMLLFRHNLRAALIVGLVTVVPLIGVYHFVSSYRGADDSFLVRAARVASWMSKYANSSKEEQRVLARNKNVPFPLASPLKRFAWTIPFAQVIQSTPDKVPFWHGETYKPLITDLVPRAFWPDKPEERTGYAFGVRYGIINPLSTHISINLPWLIEFYANFGTPGVLIGMTVIGIFLAFLDKFFNDPRLTGIEAACGIAIIFPLFYQESNLSVMIGSLPLLALSLFVYFNAGLWFLLRLGIVHASNTVRREPGNEHPS